MITVGALQAQKYVDGKKYHYIDPTAYENKIITSLLQASSLEGDPQVIVYLYVDDEFAYKSRVYPRSANPNINLDIDM